MKTCPTCGAPHSRRQAYCASCHAAYMREWRKTHPLTPEQAAKDRCRSYAGTYLRRGVITRQPCQGCGGEAQMHWEDYSKPLEITWLCAPCRRATQAVGQLHGSSAIDSVTPPGPS